MCVLNKERVESQMMVAGVDHNIIDLQFGRGFTDRVLNGRKVTVDEGRRLCKNLKCNLEYLKGADIIDANDDSDEIYFEISSSILKQRRTALGYSQKALSELMANKSSTYFSKLESDNHTGRVRKTTLQGLAHYLKCSEEYLQGYGGGIGTPPELPDSIRDKRIVCKLQWEVVNRKVAQLHISPTKLARRVGMPRTAITRGKVDGGEVPVCVANAIANAFGMDVGEIAFAYNRPDLLEEERGVSMIEQVSEIAKSNLGLVEKAINSNPFDVIRDMPTNHIAPTNILPPTEQQNTVPKGSISFANLAAVAKIGETNPEVFDLMLQIAELSPEQIKSVASTIDLLVKGMIVS